jgi:hypothetical protein
MHTSGALVTIPCRSWGDGFGTFAQCVIGSGVSRSF